MSSDARFREYHNYIEKYLGDFYSQFKKEPQGKLFEAMKYSLLVGGKRIRPILAFEFCRLCSGDWKSAAPFAAGGERDWIREKPMARAIGFSCIGVWRGVGCWGPLW